MNLIRGAAIGVVACVAVVTGASNMGFQIVKELNGPNAAGSRSGTQDVGLPFNLRADIRTASDLRQYIVDSGGTAVSVSSFDPRTDALQTYAGISPAWDFGLDAGEGYRIKLANEVDLSIVGTHDPGLIVNLNGPFTNGSASGSQLYSLPYHATATTASELRDEILSGAGGSVSVTVSRYDPARDALETYAGIGPSTDFQLKFGEAYLIKVSRDIAYIPSHY